MVCYYPDQGCVSDKLCSKGNLLQKLCPDLVSDSSSDDRQNTHSSPEFLDSFLRLLSAAKPVLTSQNVGCFLRLNSTELEVFYCIFFSMTVGSGEVVIQSSSSTVVSFTSGSACAFLGHLTLKVCIINFKQSFY